MVLSEGGAYREFVNMTKVNYLKKLIIDMLWRFLNWKVSAVMLRIELARQSRLCDFGRQDN